MWDISQFDVFLKQKYNNTAWQEIQDKIKKLIIISLDSCRQNISNRQNSHELLGYDIMIDEMLNIWLIEVNSSPAMDYSTVKFNKYSLLLKDW